MRILHFSDIHVNIPLREVPLRDWLGKRLVGGANHLLRRRKHFLEVPEKMAGLATFAKGYDLAVCTGDYSVIGSEPEFAFARTLVEPFASLPQGFVTIPGNHDIYTWDSVREKRFEKYFSAYMQSDIDTKNEGLAVRLWDDFAVVSVRSTRPNPPPWRSSGRVTDDVLARLKALLQQDALRTRVVMLITHYAMCQHDGRPDSWLHHLENVDALIDVAKTHPRLFLAHGHVHRRFHRIVDGVPVFGAGSATQAHREGIWSFEVGPGRVVATPGKWTGVAYALTESPIPVFA